MSIDKKDIKCSRCGKEIPRKGTYAHNDKLMCEDCALHAGMFPLGHTGHLKQSYFIKDRKR